MADVLDDLRNRSGANIVANWQSLDYAGIFKTTPVSLQLHNVSAAGILKVILQNLSTEFASFSYVIQDNVVVISTSEDLAKIVDTRVYDVTHLMMETKDKRGGSAYSTGGSRNDRYNDNRSGSSGDRYRDRNDRYGSRDSRNRNRGDRYGRSTSISTSRSGYGTLDSNGTERKERIMELVRTAVAEDSWRDAGGAGAIRVFGTRLVITQTIDNHAKIAKTFIGW